MEGIRSSTSSSERGPGRGLALACLLLAALRILHPPPAGVVLPGDQKPLEPFRTDLSRLAQDPPEVLLVGDSRMFEIRYPDFASGFAPDTAPPKGFVWGEGGGSVPDLLAHLEGLGVRPRVLVVGASPLSTSMGAFLRSARAGEGLPPRQRWKNALRRAVVRPFAFLPAERGPDAVAHALACRLRFRSLESLEDAFTEAPPPNVGAYRQLFEEEPVPFVPAVEDTIAALRRFREAGVSVVLVRLPVGPQMLSLEEGWGAGAVLRGIAEAAGVPLADLTRDPLAERVRHAILDESHVQREPERRLMSEEVGRRVREALGRRRPD